MERTAKPAPHMPPKLQKQRAAKSKSKSAKREPSGYFKGRPVYSEEQTAEMDCPFPDESSWIAEIKSNIAGREKRKK